jgi:hypothetical protein
MATDTIPTDPTEVFGLGRDTILTVDAMGKASTPGIMIAGSMKADPITRETTSPLRHDRNFNTMETMNTNPGVIQKCNVETIG